MHWQSVLGFSKARCQHADLLHPSKLEEGGAPTAAFTDGVDVGLREGARRHGYPRM